MLIWKHVKVDFTYVKTWSMIMHVNYTYDFLMGLLSICGGMGLHVYIAQVSLWRGCEGGLPMIWTKWVMTNDVVNEWVLIWCYEVCWSYV